MVDEIIVVKPSVPNITVVNTIINIVVTEGE
jgi:hypothetical protein